MSVCTVRQTYGTYSNLVSRGAWHFDLSPHGGSCLPVRKRRQEPPGQCVPRQEPRNKNSRFSPRAEDRDLPQDTLNCDQGQIRLDEVQASAVDWMEAPELWTGVFAALISRPGRKHVGKDGPGDPSYFDVVFCMEIIARRSSADVLESRNPTLPSTQATLVPPGCGVCSFDPSSRTLCSFVS